MKSTIVAVTVVFLVALWLTIDLAVEDHRHDDRLDAVEALMVESALNRVEVAQLRVDFDALLEKREASNAQWSRAGVYAHVAARYHGETAIAVLNSSQTEVAYSRLVSLMAFDPILAEAWTQMGDGIISPALFEFVLFERVFAELSAAILLRMGEMESRLEAPSTDEFLSKLQ